MGHAEMPPRMINTENGETTPNRLPITQDLRSPSQPDTTQTAQKARAASQVQTVVRHASPTTLDLMSLK